jgi:hypothetical protein
MYQAGNILVTDEIRRDGRDNWERVGVFEKSLGKRQITMGTIVGAIILAVIILGALSRCGVI